MYSLKDAFRWVSWRRPRDIFWGSRVWHSLQGGLGRWWHFSPHQISSLSGHAVGHGEKLCATVCGQGLFFLTSPVTLLLAEPWNSLPQSSAETKCLVILQEKPGRPVSWMRALRIASNRKKKKSPPNWWTPSSSKEGDQHQLGWIRNSSLAWSGCAVISCGVSRTWVCSTSSQAHLREDTGVCARGWGRLLKNIHSHYGSAQIALEGRINNYCLGHRLCPLFFILILFHLCFQKIHCFFSPGERSSFWSINSSTSQSNGATLKIYYGHVSSDSVAKVMLRFELKAGLMFLLSHSSD